MKSDTEKENLEQPKILKLDDDFSLVKRFIDGEDAAFQELLVRHKEKVRNIIYIAINNSSAVDDIAQDVFITVYRNLKNFRFESQFTTWLYRITVNKCKDHLRKITVRRIFAPLNDANNKEEFDNSVEQADIKKLVRAAIEKLPAKLRIPLVLKDIEGFSYQEIAESMSCEIGTVKSRIFRARQGVKKLLKPYERELMK